jgi:probable rRNA maturation factor
MKINVQFLDEHQFIKPSSMEALQSLFETAARIEGLEEGEISVTFVNDEEIQEINRTYRQMDKPTDVLSFPMYEADEEEIEVFEDEPLLLGDIIISIPTAIAQAEEYNHSFDRELGFLAVHGFLHLLGYDHEEGELAEKEMFAKQEEILAAHGLVR